ncbi:MAG TPA: hypothetical protein VMK12_07935 [Anaeromyxobacteraceae bacterium]|nr:hypothetical protein [Anaeromyxobacteraceae bacterium]
MAALLMVALTALPVAGSAHCPAPEEVGRTLESLEPLAQETVGSARLSEVGSQRLLVELFDSRGKLLASRELDVLSDCRQMANVVAVILRLWQTNLGEQLITPLELSQQSSLDHRDDKPSRWHARIGVSAGASFDAVGPAADGSATAALTFGTAPIAFGTELAAFGGTVRDRSLAVGGSATYARLGLGLNALARWTIRSLSLEPRLGVLVALLAANGSGLGTNLGASQVDAGLTVRLRLTLEQGLWRLRPFLELGGNAWPRPQEAYLGTTPTGTYFPQWEAIVLGGVAFDLR